MNKFWKIYQVFYHLGEKKIVFTVTCPPKNGSVGRDLFLFFCLFFFFFILLFILFIYFFNSNVYVWLSLCFKSTTL